MSVSVVVVVIIMFVRGFWRWSSNSIWEKSGSIFSSSKLLINLYNPWYKRLGLLSFDSSKWKKALSRFTTLDFYFQSGIVASWRALLTSLSNDPLTNAT
jgi:hypothetical protein